MNQFLETSFLPLRSFASIADLQDQADRWPLEVAHRRRVRPIETVEADALAVERGWLRPAPARWADVDQRLEVRASSDAFVRAADVDYSVPPRFARRRLAVRASLEQLSVFCDGERSRSTAGPGPVPTWCWHRRTPGSCERREAQSPPGRRGHHVDGPNLPAYDELVG
jgi:hypothetical protein